MPRKKKEACDCRKDNLKHAEKLFNSGSYLAVLFNYETDECAILGHETDERQMIDSLLGAIERLRNK